MNILMVTNTYTPHVGGVARSVESFTLEYRRRGHRTMVIAPEFEDMPEGEEDVIRVSAIQNFNGSDFSVVLPIPRDLYAELENFKPDVVHSHHPFLLGSTALRISSHYDVPLVFTHHTMYERYTHYVPMDSPRMKKFVISLSVGYCNLCDLVIAPSESVANLLSERGVETRVEAVPTGVYVDKFRRGDGAAFRRENGIPENVALIGHLGRLAPEKNLAFLARSVARFLRNRDNIHFLVVGTGPSEEEIHGAFREAGLSDRLHFTGKLQGQALVDAYHAMDVFAFASQSETQGMVLTEAMAAGVPVIAVDASGVREVFRENQNGRILDTENEDSFVEALHWFFSLSTEKRKRLRQGALETAARFSMDRCVDRTLALYQETRWKPAAIDDSLWNRTLDQVNAEWDLFVNLAEATAATIQEPEPEEPSK
ncbi:glycosyltransferase [bacterium]|nr:glycosyltransferase [bacterium]